MADNASKIGILILAAGASSRMGMPKQVLEIKGTPMLSMAINAALHTGIGPVGVVIGANRDRVIEVCKQDSIVRIDHPEWSRGMGSSISLGTAEMLKEFPELSGLLVMVADQPEVDSTHLLKLCEFKMEYDITATIYPNGQPGVPAFFGKNYFPDLLNLPPEKGAKDFLYRSKEMLHSVYPEFSLKDIDTPEDYKAMLDLMKENSGNGKVKQNPPQTT